MPSNLKTTPGNLRHGWGSLLLCCQDAYSLRPSGRCRRLVTVPCAARAADGLVLQPDFVIFMLAWLLRNAGELSVSRSVV